MLLDDILVAAYYKQIVGATLGADGIWIFPCKAQLRDIRLGLGSVGKAIVPGRLINFRSYSQAPDCRPSSEMALLVAIADFPFLTVCEGSLQNSTSIVAAGGSACLGQVFMQAQFVVFHEGNRRLGSAPRV